MYSELKLCATVAFGVVISHNSGQLKFPAINIFEEVKTEE